MDIKEMVASLEKKQKILQDTRKQLRTLESLEEGLEINIKHLKEQIQNERRGELAPVLVSLYGEDRFNGPKDVLPVKSLETLQVMLDLKKATDDSVGFDCYFEEDDFGVRFSMDADEMEKTFQGKVQFVMYGYDEEDYMSPVLEDPTTFEAFQYFHQSVYTTGNKHHIFLEGFDAEDIVDGVRRIRFITGS